MLYQFAYHRGGVSLKWQHVSPDNGIKRSVKFQFARIA
jgi:hypothetical protein